MIWTHRGGKPIEENQRGRHGKSAKGKKNGARERGFGVGWFLWCGVGGVGLGSWGCACCLLVGDLSVRWGVGGCLGGVWDWETRGAGCGG